MLTPPTRDEPAQTRKDRHDRRRARPTGLERAGPEQDVHGRPRHSRPPGLLPAVQGLGRSRQRRGRAVPVLRLRTRGRSSARSGRNFREEEDDWVRTPTIEIQAPRVIRLLEYDKVPKQTVKFNRRNIFARDHNQCQYCGKKCPRAN